MDIRFRPTQNILQTLRCNRACIRSRSVRLLKLARAIHGTAVLRTHSLLLMSFRSHSRQQRRPTFLDNSRRSLAKSTNASHPGLLPLRLWIKVKLVLGRLLLWMLLLSIGLELFIPLLEI